MAYGESQFSPLASVLWALILHQSRCQGPFLCSFDTGLHFLQENKSVKSLVAPKELCHLLSTKVYIYTMVSAGLIISWGGEANMFCHKRIYGIPS